MDITESIRLVCEAAGNGDKEAIAIQSCIPSEMTYMGLYPQYIKAFDILPTELYPKNGNLTNVADKELHNLQTHLEYMQTKVMGFANNTEPLS